MDVCVVVAVGDVLVAGITTVVGVFVVDGVDVDMFVVFKVVDTICVAFEVVICDVVGEGVVCFGVVDFGFRVLVSVVCSLFCSVFLSLM